MLRTLTLNLWHRAGPWPDRLRILRRGLRELQPHLVGLQETLRFGSEGPWDRHNDQATELAADESYAVVFAPATDLGAGLWLGNALLSRYALRETATFELPRDETDLQRSLLFALVETPGAPTPVFVTHLSWRFDAGALRQAQVSAILEHVQRLTQPSFQRAILMGDFNAAPDTPEMRVLIAPTQDGSSPFVDSWCVARGPGYTFDPRNLFAAEAKEEPRRIDYILVERRGASPEACFQRTELAFEQAELGADGRSVWASDHFGLVTDISQ